MEQDANGSAAAVTPAAAPEGQSEAAAAAQNQTGTAGSGQGTGQNATAPGKPYMLFETGAPTQQSGVPGIAFDFNYGARVTVPQGEYRVKFIDRDACLTLYDAPASGVICTSAKKYFINFRIEVYQKQQGQDKLIFAHDLDLKGKKVVIKFPTGILGDVLAWFPYAEVFRNKHGCRLYCALGEEMAELFKPAYRQINFIKPDAKIEDAYATYYMGIFFPCDDRVHQPSDFRVRGLHKNAAMILGLDEGTEAPDVYIKLTPKNRQRQIKEPYVCIAAQASGQAKYWNNGRGWINVVKYLKQKGYRVLCIDRDSIYGQGSRFNLIPYGAEDFTGQIPLQERIDLLQYADFFIGLSSGLSWVANGMGKPVIMISGFTLPLNEFYTPYRLINYHVCNGCWNDTTVTFDHHDFEWCPRHKGTDRQFECSRFITPEAVCSVIDRLMKDYGLNPLSINTNKSTKEQLR